MSRDSREFLQYAGVGAGASGHAGAIAGMLRYRPHPAFNLGFGVNGMPGTRTLGGSHPYWLGHDQVMADEFFRPGFTSAAWVEGQIVPRLFSNFMVGTNLSELGQRRRGHARSCHRRLMARRRMSSATATPATARATNAS